MKVTAPHFEQECSPPNRIEDDASISPQFRQWQRHRNDALFSWSSRGSGNGAQAVGIHWPGRKAIATMRRPISSSGNGRERGIWNCIKPRKIVITSG